MLKRIALTTKQKVDIITEYQEQLTPMIELARTYGISRQGIYKVLKKAGVNTTKRRLDVSCTTCAKVFPRTKAKIRRQLNNFCSPDCYHAFLAAGNGSPYIYSRHGQRIGRTIISQYFQLQEGHISHHENRNNLDNRPVNLRVFACQGDHVRYHRGFDVDPIWDGRDI